MSLTNRIMDVQGDEIYPTKHYSEALELINKMVNTMEENNTDRSDMIVVLDNLFHEARFNLKFLPKREYK